MDSCLHKGAGVSVEQRRWVLRSPPISSPARQLASSSRRSLAPNAPPQAAVTCAQLVCVSPAGVPTDLTRRPFARPYAILIQRRHFTAPRILTRRRTGPAASQQVCQSEELSVTFGLSGVRAVTAACSHIQLSPPPHRRHRARCAAPARPQLGVGPDLRAMGTLRPPSSD